MNALRSCPQLFGRELWELGWKGQKREVKRELKQVVNRS